jgi:hypothetical protein
VIIAGVAKARANNNSPASRNEVQSITLWSVAPTATRYLSTSLFRHLKDGRNLADTLR